MKTLTTALLALVLSAGIAAAQDSSGSSARNTQNNGVGDVNGYSAHQFPGLNPAQVNLPPNPKVVLKPQLGGILVDGAKYGWMMISPGAPASWGNGEKYLSAPDPRYDLAHECGPAAHRDSGGLKLFSFEF